MPQKTYKEIINSFSACTVGVIGDMMLDIYVFGKPARLSREAPVIVVEFEHEDIRPGGGANAAGNFRSLGANVEAVGVIGKDTHGEQLRKILADSGIRTDGLLVTGKRQTITKTRILAGDIHTAKQQVLRIDRGQPAWPDPQVGQPVLEYISRISPSVDCWLVSDYGYGFITGEIENSLADLAVRVPVVADSRYNVKEFSRITAVTPNESEALSFGKYYLKDETDLKVIGQQMLEILFLKCVLITRGNEGMLVFEKDKNPLEIPVVGSAESVDVSGAGDTVAATFGLGLACGASPEQAARLANCAASVVVMKSGTATCSKEELLKTVEKIS
jgi:rfaE bifunctional protein kinase chain/domain